LNNLGQLLVTQLGSTFRLWIWQNGTATEIPLPYSTYEYFFGGAINDSGTLAGQISAPQFNGQFGAHSGQLIRGYLWQNDVFTLFDQDGSAGIDINNAGTVAGYVMDQATYDYQVGFWQTAQTFVPIGVTGQYYNVDMVINDNGTILVSQSVNVTVGTGTSGYTFQNYIWTPSVANAATGTLTTLSGLSPLFGATDLNASGVIVGTLAMDATGVTTHAALVPAGSPTDLVDLNLLISADSGWVLEKALSINDAGQITGQGIFTDASGTTQTAAFLLTPAV